MRVRREALGMTLGNSKPSVAPETRRRLQSRSGNCDAKAPPMIDRPPEAQALAAISSAAAARQNREVLEALLITSRHTSSHESLSGDITQLQRSRILTHPASPSLKRADRVAKEHKECRTSVRESSN
jgi:hypothetical protein